MSTAAAGHAPPLTILVPLDGSPRATVALDAATRLQPGRIVLLHVHASVDLIIPDIPPDDDEADLREVRESMEDLAAPLREAGHEVEVLIRAGDAATVIVDEASRVDLIVMTTKGRGAAGRAIFGSVADRVSRTSETPALLVRARASQELTTPARIVVPLDGSPTAEQALPVAMRLAATIGCPIALARAIDLDDVRATIAAQRKAGEADQPYEAARTATEEAARLYLETHRGRLVANGYDASSILLDGTPSFALIAETSERDLVVMSSQGRSGYRRWLLGSVAEKLVREANAPVVMVPATSGDAAGNTAQPITTTEESPAMTDQPTDHGTRNVNDLLHKDTYTPEEISYLLGIDHNVILQAAHRHELPAVFIGNDVATIKRSDLLRWLESR